MKLLSAILCLSDFLEFVHHVKDAALYFLDGADTVYLVIFLNLLVVLDERLGLVVVCYNTGVYDGLAGVVCAAFLEGAAFDAFHDHCVRNHD